MRTSAAIGGRAESRLSWRTMRETQLCVLEEPPPAHRRARREGMATDGQLPPQISTVVELVTLHANRAMNTLLALLVHLVDECKA
jgi:hypothetical protein